jgi:hypothetical protein
MSNLLFAYPFYSDVNQTYTPTLSGGAWSVSLPLTNLQDRRLSKVARSSNALAASTQFIVDLQTARGIRVFALPKHNLSIAATIRVTGSANSDGVTAAVYDSGTVSVYGSIYPTGTLPTGHPSFTTRIVTAEELAEQQAAGLNYGYALDMGSHTSARYWKVAITDTGNADGYVELGRLVLAAAWQPSINMTYGAKLGFETSTTRSESDGGSAIYNERVRRRTFSCAIEGLPENEAMVSVLDMQKYLGTHKQLFFMFDSSDTSHMHRRSFLCVHRELSALDFPYYGRNSVPVGLVEEL